MVERDSLWKHLALAFVLALALYLIGFPWLEHHRSRRGPWEVTFVSESQAPPRITVNQPALGITNVQIVFEGVTAPAPTQATIGFAAARQVPFPVPFGECVFLDLLFLPGTVTLDLFNHQIELLPRTLSIDGREQEWRSGMRFELKPPP
ncbi:MAG: hypothetical protein MUE94_04880 [Verrucomicrobia bacterium]|jgi:hypothetical protein|nr:hypothetical protein [Verrucomicrobiota bacterium]